jgi:hypothetical protein
MPAKLYTVRNSPIHGRGVFAAVDIKRGTRILEYRGKRLSHPDADRLYGGTVESGHTFLFTLNDEYVIDANQGGNAARWINHGCAPNCESVCEAHESEAPRLDRVFIDAIRDIPAGAELTYSYFITLEQRHTLRLQRLWKCLCGAKRCKGTMLDMTGA